MHRLATALDTVKATRSRREKLKLLAELFAPLSEVELTAAVRLIAAAPLATADSRTLGVGWALVIDALAEAAGLSEVAVTQGLRATGDLGEGIEPIWPVDRPGLPLAEVPALFEALAATTDRSMKRAALIAALRKSRGPEVKYLVKALLGELRIGVQRNTIDDALAAAFKASPETVRTASALTPDIAMLAQLAKAGALSTATLVPGRVVAFMLATPNESVKEPIDPALTVIEDKLDGIRAQAHVVGGVVTLFARGTGDVTRSFPDVVAALKTQRDVVLDGEILAISEAGGPRPFQALQGRLGRVAPDASVLASTPVRFIAYDVLFDGGSLLGLPWLERRARLEQLPVAVNPVTPMQVESAIEVQLETHFAAARGRGHEGLMLKRIDATYDAGKRGSAWRKVKRALATLDVVITRAEYGHGKRVGVLSDYTFGVWNDEVLVEIGKAYSGLTDKEIATLTTQLLALSQARRGRHLLIPPAIVLEIAFDGLQPSRRHDSGFALRFPRIVGIRSDKRPAEADTISTVRALFERQVQTGHRERDE